MEIDCVRSTGSNVLVSIWVAGQMRAVTVSPQAVRKWLPANQPMAAEECCEYVRTHIRLVQEAAHEQIIRGDTNATAVFLDGS